MLNTNVYYKNNNTDFDPCQQITWLEDQLKAVPEGGRVFITAHVPPGFFERDPDAAYMVNLEGDHHYNEALSAVLHKYGQKIMAHAYGHTHTDSFRLIQVIASENFFGGPNMHYSFANRFLEQLRRRWPSRARR